MVNKLKDFFPSFPEVDSFQLDHVIDMAKESGLWESEKEFAISTVDHYRKGFTTNFNNKIKICNAILIAFDTDKLLIPGFVDDEIKILQLLSDLKLNALIKSYKKYIRAKKTYDDAIEIKKDFNIDDNGLTELEYEKQCLDIQLKALNEENKLYQLEFNVKSCFKDFQEAFASTKTWQELKDELENEISNTEKLIKKIDDLAEDAITAIEDDEDIYESLEKLKGFES